MEKKKIGPGKAAAAINNDVDIIGVMKPFVHFGIKALAVLGSALVTIVRNIPKPESNKTTGNKNNRVIKI